MTNILLNPEKKRDFNRGLFAIVAPRYRFVTRALSFGKDMQNKRQCLASLDPEITGIVLDLATGDGDFLGIIKERCPSARIIGCDLSKSMLDGARKRTAGWNSLCLMRGDMMQLGVRDGTVAAITGGYALRNAPDLLATLDEIHRVLKADGVGFFLEFSRSENRMVSFFQIQILRCWCGLWGLLLHGRPWVYGYIADSLQVFPDRAALHRTFSRYGFEITGSCLKLGGFIELLAIRKVR